MGELHFCPICNGKLVAISERTGGFDGKKAAIGMVIAGGAAGLAAGATGKQLVTLKCSKCGYTIEMDAQSAREEIEFEKKYEQFLQGRSQFPRTPLPEPDMRDNSVLDFQIMAYRNRAKEREQIDSYLDWRLKEIKKSHESLLQMYQEQLDKLTAEKEAQERQLTSLGFFKFFEKNTLKEKIMSLSSKIEETTAKKTNIEEEMKDEEGNTRRVLVDVCRNLAIMWMEEHIPTEYHEYLQTIYSGIGSEPEPYTNLWKRLDPDRSSWCNSRPSKLRTFLISFPNPFTSFDGYNIYFGADNEEVKEYVESWLPGGKCYNNTMGWIKINESTQEKAD